MGVTDFHEIFMKCQARHKKCLAILFHSWLDCFTILHLGEAECVDFHEIFWKGLLWHKEQTGANAFNPLDTGLSFPFSGSVFVGNIME